MKEECQSSFWLHHRLRCTVLILLIADVQMSGSAWRFSDVPRSANGRQAENDELRLQEIEDRKNIQHLLGVTKPVQQEITYERGGLPSSVTVYPNR